MDTDIQQLAKPSSVIKSTSHKALPGHKKTFSQRVRRTRSRIKHLKRMYRRLKQSKHTDHQLLQRLECAIHLAEQHRW